MVRKKSIFWFLVFCACGHAGSKESRPSSGAVAVSSSTAEDRHSSSSGPIIEIWYDDSENIFTQGGAQRFLNILGSVTSPKSSIAKLEARMNDQAIPIVLSLGPDGRRLARAGDFNLELDKENLRPGLHTVEIRAEDFAGRQKVKSSVFILDPDELPVADLKLDLTHPLDPGSTMQFVDGLWSLERKGLRTVEPGYDRAIAFGDVGWRDYEVEILMTVHGLEEMAYGLPLSGGPAFGINLHWLGHTDIPVTCKQPRCGWHPIGGAFWYVFRENRDDFLQLFVEHGGGAHRVPVERIAPERYFRLMASVRRDRFGLREYCGSLSLTDGKTVSKEPICHTATPDQTNGPLAVDSPEPGGLVIGPGEKTGWTQFGQFYYDERSSELDPVNGAILFVAHHVDLSIREISVHHFGNTNEKR